MIIGKRVQLRREVLGWSQGQLAERLPGKVSQQSIDQLEKGAVRAPKYAYALPEVLGVPMAWLQGMGEAAAPDLAASAAVTSEPPGPPPGPPSGPMINIAALTEIITILEAALDRDQRQMAPAARALFIAKAYRACERRARERGGAADLYARTVTEVGLDMLAHDELK